MSEFSTIESSYSKVPVQDIEERWMSHYGIRLLMKREDLIHPEISGNKWRKLKYNLIEAKKQNLPTLLTFGGAYSNHIYSTAAAGKKFGFKTIGIIRGEEPQILNPTLRFAEETGMRLFFVSRAAYRDKDGLLSQMPLDLKSVYILPEGGTNGLALKGCSEIVTTYNLASNIDYWCVSCGTGGTLAGIVTALPAPQKAIGFSALKGDFLKMEAEKLLLDFTNKKYQSPAHEKPGLWYNCFTCVGLETN